VTYSARSCEHARTRHVSLFGGWVGNSSIPLPLLFLCCRRGTPRPQRYYIETETETDYIETETETV